MYNKDSTLSILIVDSHIEIINRVKDFLLEIDNNLVLFTAQNYDDAILLVRLKNPEFVILDLNLPQNKSFGLLKFLKSFHNKIQIIVLSIHVDSHTINQCKKLGVDCFLDKYYEFDKIPEFLNLRKIG